MTIINETSIEREENGEKGLVKVTELTQDDNSRSNLGSSETIILGKMEKVRKLF